MQIRTINQLASILRFDAEYILELSSRCQNCYHPYKKEHRTIDNPSPELRKIQRSIKENILDAELDKLPNCMYGARKGKSVTDCARVHIGEKAILAMDLAECYPSISAGKVYRLYRRQFRYDEKIARILTELSTFDGHLPQGAPTSSAICNLILSPLMSSLDNAAMKSNLNFSNIVDDIFFSGDLPNLYKAKHITQQAVRDAGLHLKSEKTLVYENSECMQVTNVVVNRKISAGKKRIRTIKHIILGITMQDLKKYLTIREAVKSAQKKKLKVPKYKTKIHNILGQIANVSSINPEQGEKLKAQLDKKLATLSMKNY